MDKVRAFLVCGDYVWVRRFGKILKRRFVGPLRADYFIAQDSLGETEIYHWNLVYGNAAEDDDWEKTT
jgi:hypothetical protein